MSVAEHIDHGEPKKPRKTALVKAEAAQAPASPVGETASIMHMIERMVTDPTMSSERMSQAFEFYQRVKADASRRAFDAAMAEAKAEFTPIIKRHLVEYGEDKKKTSYKHEDLIDIANMVDPILGKHGITYRYRTASNINEPVKVTCVVSHRDGYFEENTLTAGRDATGGKNEIQAMGSTLTYLQRYSLKAALGLATGRDTDGVKPVDDGELISESQYKELADLIRDTGTDLQKFLAIGNVESLSEIQAAQFGKAKAMLLAKKRAAQ